MKRRIVGRVVLIAVLIATLLVLSRGQIDFVYTGF